MSESFPKRRDEAGQKGRTLGPATQKWGKANRPAGESETADREAHSSMKRTGQRNMGLSGAMRKKGRRAKLWQVPPHPRQ